MTSVSAKTLRRLAVIAVAAAPILAGCETVSSTMFPDAPATPAAAQTPPNIVSAPQAGTAQFQPVAVKPGAPSGTTAGASIAQVRSSLVSVQGQLAARNVTLSAIRQGWTQDVAAYRVQKNQVLRPGPQTDARVAAAQGDGVLKRLTAHTARLNAEMEGFAQGNAQTNALMARLDTVNAESDQDREQLGALRTEIVSTSTSLDALVNQLSSESAQANAFIAKERASLASLGAQANAAPATRATIATPVAGPAMQPIAPPTTATKPPAAATKPAFVTIKFDRPSVTYREALAAALKQALARRPDAAFDVIGVTAQASEEAEDLVKARAEDVSRTMMELGVSAAKIGIESMRVKSAASDEVRIFVR